MGLRDIRYTIGPFVTLIDGPDFFFHWEARPGLIKGHIQEADSIAISRADRIDSGKTETICATLNIQGQNILVLDHQNSSVIGALAQQIMSDQITNGKHKM